MARTKAKQTQQNAQGQSQTRSHSLKIKIDHLKTINPLTQNQKLFFNSYNRGDTFIGLLGSAGTGKSYISCYKAAEEVLDHGNPLEKIVIVRSSVFVRDSGFLPGTMDEKMEIFEKPYIDIFSSLFERSDTWMRLKEQGIVSFIPTAAIRGISIDNAVIIVDEFQSMTFHELNSIVTRCGRHSKILFVGDTKQTDLVKSKNDVSGLGSFIKVAETMKEFNKIIFTPEDIVRSSLVKSWIIACEKIGV